MNNYKIENIGGQKRVTVDAISGTVVIDTNAPDNSRVTFTATTDMQRSLGKLLSLDENGVATVDTVWDNSRRKMSNVSASEDCNPGDAVVIMEHLTLSGEMELVCSKAAPDTGDINFLNLCWRDLKLRIDLVTGEFDHVNIN